MSTLVKKIHNLLIGNGLSSLSDEELIILFKEYFEQTNDFVRSSIYWMVRSSDVEDLVQESYLKAWKSFRLFDQKSSFKTWIYRIAMNTTYDYLRKSKEVNSQETIDSSSGISDDLSDKDLVTKSLMELSIKHREVFILFYKFDYKIDEIADTLSVPSGTVKSRLNKARDVFKNAIAIHGDGHE